jgi:hypothetical protein
MKRRQIHILILVLSTILSPLFGQELNNKIIFEQKALDFFADSIVNKIVPFKDLEIHFNGLVDSSLTTVQYKMISRYPDDKLLNEEYQKSNNAQGEFWSKNKKPTFWLDIKKPVKNKIKKHYGKKNKAIRLMIFQNKKVGDKNIVWFRTFVKDGYNGYDFYFIMDKVGKVTYWYYDTFIF